ncbi:allatostatin double C [Tachypleus tridentatus]|uniref:allatostatin double C n=1 Tax=Tachypleus tridentatus TaxID=6853 RepID=UPI003FD4BB21
MMAFSSRFTMIIFTALLTTSFLFELALSYPTDQELDVDTTVLKDSLPKRSTMLLNKLMNALQNALQEDDIVSHQMELQRRGDGRKFWRCYFNAVSCFRRK